MAPRSLVRLSAIAPALLGLACSSASQAPVKHDPLVLPFGPDEAPIVATVTPDDGALVVKAPWADPLLRSPAGRSFLAVRLDPADPGGFHDPDVARDAEFVDLRDLAPIDRGTLKGTIRGYPSSEVLVAFSPIPELGPDLLDVEVTISGAPVVQIELRLAADDGSYVGLGERFDHVDAKGTRVPLALRAGPFASGTNEAHVPVPLFVNSRGYGVEVFGHEVGAADVAADEPGVVRMVFEGSSLQAFLFAARDPLAIVAVATPTRGGHPDLPPRWAFAPMQSRGEGATAAELLDDLRRTRALGIPGGSVWIHDPWQRSYDDSTFDPIAFPDPARMIADARALGFETSVWSAPYLQRAETPPANAAQALYAAAAAKGYLITEAAGLPFETKAGPGGTVRVGMLDLASSSASGWWSNELRAVTTLGTAGFELAPAEDLMPEVLGRRLELTIGGGPARKNGPTFPIAYARAYRKAFDGLRADAFVLARARSDGGHEQLDALGAPALEGDFGRHQAPHVGGLPASVCAMVSLAASGFPHYVADTGGALGGRPTKERLLRWAEVGAHSMLFQGGGAGPSRAPWTYDAETVTHFRALARRHMELYPYLRGLSLAAHVDGTPTVRALPLAFPAEVKAIGAHADDEYLLGPDLLVAPVMTDGALAREVYVPTGAWTRWSTGARLIGPRLVTEPAALGDPIVLVREGALLPLLAADVDTLGDATDPSVVTAAKRATTFRAYAVPYATATATWEDGTRLDVNGGTDKNQAIVVAFVPQAAVGRLTLTMDLASRTTFPTTWTIDGATPPVVASEAAADACADACMFVDATKKRVTLHLAEGGSASGSK